MITARRPEREVVVAGRQRRDRTSRQVHDPQAVTLRTKRAIHDARAVRRQRWEPVVVRAFRQFAGTRTVRLDHRHLRTAINAVRLAKKQVVEPVEERAERPDAEHDRVAFRRPLRTEHASVGS